MKDFDIWLKKLGQLYEPPAERVVENNSKMLLRDLGVLTEDDREVYYSLSVRLFCKYYTKKTQEEINEKTLELYQLAKDNFEVVNDSNIQSIVDYLIAHDDSPTLNKPRESSEYVIEISPDKPNLGHILAERAQDIRVQVAEQKIENACREQEYENLFSVDKNGFYSLEISYPCRHCGENTVLECEIEEFDPLYHYCGKDPRCCP